MRRALVLAGLGLMLSVAPLPTATASCAGPELDVEPGLSIARGEELTIEGLRFVDGCNDTGSCTRGLGCETCTMADEETPMDDVRLALRRGDRTWPLGEADADSDGDVAWTVELPDGVRPGTAQLIASGTLRSVVPVRVR